MKDLHEVILNRLRLGDNINDICDEITDEINFAADTFDQEQNQKKEKFVDTIARKEEIANDILCLLVEYCNEFAPHLLRVAESIEPFQIYEILDLAAGYVQNYADYIAYQDLVNAELDSTEDEKVDKGIIVPFE